MTLDEAIKILQHVFHYYDEHSQEITWNDLNEACGMAINALKNERPQAEWICTSKSSFPQYEPDEYRCSNCNGAGYLLDKFCKHCGKRMKVINDD